MKTLKYIRNLTLAALMALAVFHWPYVRAVARKATGKDERCPWGKLAQLPVSAVRFEFLKQSYARRVKAVEYDAHFGIEKFDSPSRPFWIRKEGQAMNGQALLAFILAEQKWLIDSGSDLFHRGDVVVDIGAHVGTFGDDALRHGASLVVMVEPDPVNVECIRRNFRAEIADGRVVVVPEGAWSSESTLEFSTGVTNSGTGSFVIIEEGGARVRVRVRPLDDILQQIGIHKVDVIKIDIEGGEREALKGARQTLARHRPRLMLDAYHLPDDPILLPTLIREGNADYTEFCPVCSVSRDRSIVPHALLFR
jgi:FkbM family methyltransferase